MDFYRQIILGTLNRKQAPFVRATSMATCTVCSFFRQRPELYISRFGDKDGVQDLRV